ncbi:MAG TPA: prolyl oligopeptidase family serine peptidase, partial [Gammaproteobacteria bacterium]|nr:prolyl oligopeptidase family serine peptidase [Gammaproteobacteria bacterium]
SQDRPLSCLWKTDAKLLCATSEKGKPRWLSINADGTDETDLHLFTTLIDLLPDQPARVLVREFGATYAPVAFVDVETGKHSIVEGTERYSDIGDGEGAIRVRRYSERHSNGWAFMPSPKTNWVMLFDDAFNTPEWFIPRAFDQRTNEILYVHLHDDRLALFAWDGHGERRLVRAEAFAHVLGVRMIGKASRAGSAVILDGQARHEPIDARVASVHDAVQRSFPTSIVNVLQEDWNQRYYLVFVGDRQWVGHYYRFSWDDGAIDDLGATHASTEKHIAARRIMLDLSAQVGRPAAAHFTVPADANGALPAIVVPAGSSNWADNIVPFLVASGFVVIENGVEPLRRGAKIGSNWQATESEIEASVRELAQRGTVDPARICAMGSELGAYVALMTAADEPELFRCIVGVNTTVDPVIGNQMVASLKSNVTVPVPVLLIGGKSDRSAGRLRSALENHGAPSAELVAYESEMFGGATAKTVDQLARIGEFFAAHLH